MAALRSRVLRSSGETATPPPWAPGEPLSGNRVWAKPLVARVSGAEARPSCAPAAVVPLPQRSTTSEDDAWPPPRLVAMALQRGVPLPTRGVLLLLSHVELSRPRKSVRSSRPLAVSRAEAGAEVALARRCLGRRSWLSVMLLQAGSGCESCGQTP